jgi:hypothetical protein
VFAEGLTTDSRRLPDPDPKTEQFVCQLTALGPRALRRLPTGKCDEPPSPIAETRKMRSVRWEKSFRAERRLGGAARGDTPRHSEPLRCLTT